MKSYYDGLNATYAAFVRMGISAVAQLVMLHLMQLNNELGRTGYIKVSDRELKWRTNLSIDSITRAKKELSQVGLIIMQTDKENPRAGTRYELTIYSGAKPTVQRAVQRPVQSAVQNEISLLNAHACREELEKEPPPPAREKPNLAATELETSELVSGEGVTIAASPKLETSELVSGEGVAIVASPKLETSEKVLGEEVTIVADSSPTPKTSAQISGEEIAARPQPEKSAQIPNRTISAKLDEVLDAWHDDEQMPVLYATQESRLRALVLTGEATVEQLRQAIERAKNRNSPLLGKRGRGVNFNYVIYQLEVLQGKRSEKRKKPNQEPKQVQTESTTPKNEPPRIRKDEPDWRAYVPARRVA